MEEVKLSARARRSEAALEKTNERLLVKGLEMEVKSKALEELIQRKEFLIQREQEFLAAMDAEHEAINADIRRIQNMSTALP